MLRYYSTAALGTIRDHFWWYLYNFIQGKTFACIRFFLCSALLFMTLVINKWLYLHYIHSVDMICGLLPVQVCTNFYIFIFSSCSVSVLGPYETDKSLFITRGSGCRISPAINMREIMSIRNQYPAYVHYKMREEIEMGGKFPAAVEL